jgi:nitrite reductase/ring-hydroxylating ferredoxin subunit
VVAVVDGRVRVGPIDEIPDGQERIVAVLDNEVGVYNLHGEYYAVRNYCPHRGAPICRGIRTGTMVPSTEVGRYEWGLEGQVLRCPWHRWEFDLVTGRTLFETDKRRLIQYRVTVEDGQIYLHLRPEELRRLQHGEPEPAADAMN